MSATMAKRPRNKAKAAQEAVNNQGREQYTGAVSAAVEWFGQCITWDPPDDKSAIKYPVLVQALKDAGLDSDIAKELAPRNAFSRACKALAAERLIRTKSDENGLLTFQFNKATFENEQWDYPFETELVLNKTTGDISCPIAELQSFAKSELDRCMEDRTTGDITGVIQRLFDKQAVSGKVSVNGLGMFSMRRAGGVYFVPQEYAGFIQKVDVFLTNLGWRLNRLPIPKGTPEGDRTVKDSVASGIATIIADYEAAVESFSVDTRDSTLERAAKRIEITRAKVQAYACYLQDKVQDLELALDEAAAKLKEKVGAVTAEKDAVVEAENAEFNVECDFCGAFQAIPGRVPEHLCRRCGKTFQIDWS